MWSYCSLWSHESSTELLSKQWHAWIGFEVKDWSELQHILTYTPFFQKVYKVMENCLVDDAAIKNDHSFLINEIFSIGGAFNVR